VCPAGLPGAAPAADNPAPSPYFFVEIARGQCFGLINHGKCRGLDSNFLTATPWSAAALDLPAGARQRLFGQNQGASEMSTEITAPNPHVLDCLAMRAAAKEKLAASANTRDIFHRLCLLHRLNRRHNGHWQGNPVLEAARKTK
jgi:hypothetical protein